MQGPWIWFSLLLVFAVVTGGVGVWMALASDFFGQDAVWTTPRPYTWDFEYADSEDLRRFDELSPTSAALELVRQTYPPWQERRIARRIAPRLEAEIRDGGFRDTELNTSRLMSIVIVHETLHDFNRVNDWLLAGAEADDEFTREVAAMMLNNPHNYRPPQARVPAFLYHPFSDLRWLSYHYAGWFMVAGGLALCLATWPMRRIMDGAAERSWAKRMLLVARFPFLAVGALLCVSGAIYAIRQVISLS